MVPGSRSTSASRRQQNRPYVCGAGRLLRLKNEIPGSSKLNLPYQGLHVRSAEGGVEFDTGNENTLFPMLSHAAVVHKKVDAMATPVGLCDSPCGAANEAAFQTPAKSHTPSPGSRSSSGKALQSQEVWSFAGRPQAGRGRGAGRGILDLLSTEQSGIVTVSPRLQEAAVPLGRGSSKGHGRGLGRGILKLLSEEKSERVVDLAACPPSNQRRESIGESSSEETSKIPLTDPARTSHSSAISRGFSLGRGLLLQSLVHSAPVPSPGHDSTTSLVHSAPVPSPGHDSTTSLVHSAPVPSPGRDSTASLVHSTPIPSPGQDNASVQQSSSDVGARDSPNVGTEHSTVPSVDVDKHDPKYSTDTTDLVTPLTDADGQDSVADVRVQVSAPLPSVVGVAAGSDVVSRSNFSLGRGRALQSLLHGTATAFPGRNVSDQSLPAPSAARIQLSVRDSLSPLPDAGVTAPSATRTLSSVRDSLSPLPDTGVLASSATLTLSSVRDSLSPLPDAGVPTCDSMIPTVQISPQDGNTSGQDVGIEGATPLLDDVGMQEVAMPSFDMGLTTPPFDVGAQGLTMPPLDVGAESLTTPPLDVGVQASTDMAQTSTDVRLSQDVGVQDVAFDVDVGTHTPTDVGEQVPAQGVSVHGVTSQADTDERRLPKTPTDVGEQGLKVPSQGVSVHGVTSPADTEGRLPILSQGLGTRPQESVSSPLQDLVAAPSAHLSAHDLPTPPGTRKKRHPRKKIIIAATFSSPPSSPPKMKVAAQSTVSFASPLRAQSLPVSPFSEAANTPSGKTSSPKLMTPEEFTSPPTSEAKSNLPSVPSTDCPPTDLPPTDANTEVTKPSPIACPIQAMDQSPSEAPKLSTETDAPSTILAALPEKSFSLPSLAGISSTLTTPSLLVPPQTTEDIALSTTSLCSHEVATTVATSASPTNSLSAEFVITTPPEATALPTLSPANISDTPSSQLPSLIATGPSVTCTAAYTEANLSSAEVASLSLLSPIAEDAESPPKMPSAELEIISTKSSPASLPAGDTAIPAAQPTRDPVPATQPTGDPVPTSQPTGDPLPADQPTDASLSSSGAENEPELIRKRWRSDGEVEKRIATLERSIHCRQVELKKLEVKNKAMAKELSEELEGMERDEAATHYAQPYRLEGFDALVKLSAKAVMTSEKHKISAEIREDFKERSYSKLGTDKLSKMELDLVLREDDLKERVAAAKAKSNLIQGKLDFYVNDNL